MTRTHWDALHMLATPEDPRTPAELAPLLGLPMAVVGSVCRDLLEHRLAYCFGVAFACSLHGFELLAAAAGAASPPRRLAPETLVAHLSAHPEATLESVAVHFGLPERIVRRRLTEARAAELLTTHRLLEAA